jgi:hypothetical protein
VLVIPNICKSLSCLLCHYVFVISNICISCLVLAIIAQCLFFVYLCLAFSGMDMSSLTSVQLSLLLFIMDFCLSLLTSVHLCLVYVYALCMSYLCSVYSLWHILFEYIISLFVHCLSSLKAVRCVLFVLCLFLLTSVCVLCWSSGSSGKVTTNPTAAS